MFTGLIREIATVVSFENNFLTLRADYTPKIGDSIAINGACLTVVEVFNNQFSVELSFESQNILAMENYKDRVHIEPAMMMGDRFEGHIVQGHIDCLGEITNIIDNKNSTDFYITIPKEYAKYLIPKGSITVDGVSLTLNDIDGSTFRLTIIPHTMKNTLFETYSIGSSVNIETDMFARYIDNLIDHKNKKNETSWEQIDKILASY